MSTTPTTTVKRLSISRGERRPDGSSPDAALSGRATAKPAKGKVYVVAEARGQAGEEVRHKLARAVAEAYYRDSSSSITSSLTRAIHEASKLIPPPAARSRAAIGVGITCAVIRGEDCYVAQAGPSLALVAHRAESYMSAGLDLFAEPDDLGIERNPALDVRLSHTRVRLGDIIVLAGSDLAQSPAFKLLGPSLRGKSASHSREVVFDCWQGLGDDGDFDAVIIEMVDEDDLDTKPIASPPPPARVKAPAGPRATGPRRPPAKEPPEAPWGDRDDDEESPRLPGDRLLHLVDGAGSSVKKQLRGRADANAARLRSLALIVVAALIVLGLAVGGARYIQTRETQTTILNLIDDIEAKEREASATGDPEVQRQLLLEAQGLVRQAESVDQYDRNVMAVKQRLQAAIDDLSKVATIPTARVVADLTAAGASGEPRQLILSGQRLFVLDPSARTLFQLILSDGGNSADITGKPALLKRGDTVGEARVGGLVGMTWVPAGGEREKDALVSLDDRGLLYEYDPSTQAITPLNLFQTDLSGEAPLLGGYAGNLYLLDADSNRLLWYPATSTGFDRVVYNYLSVGQTADFTGAMALAVDSNLYVLNRDGSIARFYGGKPQSFDLTTPDIPLKHPAALAIGSDTKMLYVLDAGNDRVVAYSPDGRFDRQIRSAGAESPFHMATALAVDEAGGRLFTLSGNVVYSVEMN